MQITLGQYTGFNNVVNKDFSTILNTIDINLLNEFNVNNDYIDLDFNLLGYNFYSYNYLKITINENDYYYFIEDYQLLHGQNNIVRLFIKMDLLKTNQKYIMNTNLNYIRTPNENYQFIDNMYTKTKNINGVDLSSYMINVLEENDLQGSWYLTCFNNVRLSTTEINSLYNDKSIFNNTLTLNQSVNYNNFKYMTYRLSNFALEPIANEIRINETLNTFVKGCVFIPFKNDDNISDVAKNVVFGDTPSSLVIGEVNLLKCTIEKKLIAQIDVKKLYDLCKDITLYNNAKFTLKLPFHKNVELDYYDLFSNISNKTYLDVYYICNYMTGACDCVITDKTNEQIIYNDSFIIGVNINFNTTNQLEVDKNNSLFTLNMLSNTISLSASLGMGILGFTMSNPMMLTGGIMSTGSVISNMVTSGVNNEYNLLKGKMGDISNNSNFLYNYTPSLFMYYYPYVNHIEEVETLGYINYEKIKANISGGYTLNSNLPLEINQDLTTLNNIKELKDLLTNGFIIK